MKAFDYILEEQAYEAIGVEEVDTNIERIKAHAARRERLRNLPETEMLAEKSKMYQAFVEAFPMLEAVRKKMEIEGLSAVDLLDMLDKVGEAHGARIRLNSALEDLRHRFFPAPPPSANCGGSFKPTPQEQRMTVPSEKCELVLVLASQPRAIGRSWRAAPQRMVIGRTSANGPGGSHDVAAWRPQ
ncbi:hypothetical protein ACTTAI_00620 (plasmid) [Rhodobacter capsulatus]|uniref:hypothetical protein n=1 Tax=Rhodobacter capsulatus TaxID=1061 RepID=UPI00402642E8